ncbi:oxidoreductase [Rhodoferax lacus]|uniref:Oxidoreductase n=1 Tax=Rhodoferax lacus TaxID=2184758 RepID=A0A3E1RHX3_9BURK|nr:nitroreductase [Rhodoferax lacus]RFO98831.1 oxidoreductase [Rhodoferax lacus]
MTTPPNPDSFFLLSSQRRSVRAYSAAPVPDVLLQQVLRTARQAPSGANLQPGSFIAVQGDARARLSAELIAAFKAGQQEVEDYAYFPKPMPGVLRRRQVAAARALYGALGIAREDRGARDQQFERNFCFFEAPVALVVTIRSDFGSGGYMDLGMALYGLMLAAQSCGLSTCAIGALASYPGLVRRHLGLETDSTIVCGMALGYADPLAPVNQTVTERCELDDFFRVVG